MSESDQDDDLQAEEPGETAEETPSDAAVDGEEVAGESGSSVASQQASESSEDVDPEPIAGDGDGEDLEDSSPDSDDVVATSSLEEDDEEDRAWLGGWAYLTFLFAVFLALALVAYSCDDDDDALDTQPTTASTSAENDSSDEASDDSTALSPVALQLVVDDTTVTLRGAVPDEGARAQLVSLAEERYGEGNVVDELTIDPDATFSDGTMMLSGSAITGDENPAGLEADISAALGLTSAGFDVAFEDIELSPVDLQADIATDKVALTGVVPDQDSADALIAAAVEVWGDGNVDGSGLTIDAAYTLAGGGLRVTGDADSGDTRVTQFVDLAAVLGVAVENSVEIDTSSAALGRLEARLREALAADPILFASGSADIDPVSDAILQQAAEAIIAAPGIAVEIVGHTDSQGADARNQELSELRAEAVLDRLVELGVDADRLAARGAGEDEPIADNETDEGRAANRRIAFEFEGADDADEEDSTEEDSTEEDSTEEDSTEEDSTETEGN